MFPLLSKPLVLYQGPKIILYHKCKKIRKVATQQHFWAVQKKLNQLKKGRILKPMGQ